MTTKSSRLESTATSSTKIFIEGRRKWDRKSWLNIKRTTKKWDNLKVVKVIARLNHLKRRPRRRNRHRNIQSHKCNNRTGNNINRWLNNNSNSCTSNKKLSSRPISSNNNNRPINSNSSKSISNSNCNSSNNTKGLLNNNRDQNILSNNKNEIEKSNYF